ncbi:hypothetical protein ES703_90686 [subsurface metagenome]
MPGKGCKRKLPDKPGGKVKGRGKVLRIRTKKLPGGKYAHVRVMSKKGSKGGTTLMGDVQKKKRKK